MCIIVVTISILLSLTKSSFVRKVSSLRGYLRFLGLVDLNPLCWFTLKVLSKNERYYNW